MANATITGTASNFGSISGVLAGEAGTVAGTITGTVSGTLTGSVGVPGAGVPSGGTTGQVLKKVSNTDYDTTWGTDLASAAWGTITGTLSSQTDLQTALNLKADLASPALTGNPTAPTAATGDNDTTIATTAFVQQELAAGTAIAKSLEVYVRNQTGATLTAGTIVYIDGATGNRPTVTKAQANNDANSAQTFGFIKENIANNGFGYVIVRGELENVDTSALTEGQQLYLSPTTAGTWTTTKPYAPQHLVYVGIVIRSHPTQGVILVAIQNGYELEEIHDVKITSPSNGQVLKYDSAQGLWVNGTDSSGVAWGGITGTLSSQTDLQTALDAKAPIASPTFTGTVTIPGGASISGYANTTGSTVTFSNGILANAGITASALNVASGGVLSFAADSTQQNTAYPGASIFLLKADNLSGLGNTATARMNLGLGTMATETAANYFLGSYIVSTYAPLASPALTGTPTAPTAAVDTNTTQIASTAYVIGQGYLKSSTASSTYLTQANAASTYQTQAGMSSYLTTSAAASTYQTISGMSSYLTTSAASSTYAPLASPALTGTPTAPTAAVDTNTTQVATTAYVIGQGYLKSATASSTYAPLASPALTGTPTAPTASAGTNTTQIATTAFVQTAIPDASTTTKGKVELATLAEVLSPTSDTLAVTPDKAREMLMNPNYQHLTANGSTGTSGAGAAFTTNGRFRELASPNAATAGHAGYAADTSGNSWGFLGYTRGTDHYNHNWSKKVWASGSCMIGLPTSATFDGDSFSLAKIFIGGKTTISTGDMTNTENGIGWKVAGGGSAVMQLQVANGSITTTVASSFTPTLNDVFHWKIYSDGAGNVTLYINDSSVATTTAGPTTTNDNYSLYLEMVEQTASTTKRFFMTSMCPKLYIES